MASGQLLHDIWKDGEYGSQKLFTYFPKYEQFFEGFKDQKINLLEIGVRNGGSLEMWSKYFPHAKNIVGLDHKSKWKKVEKFKENISVEVGDQSDPVTLKKVIHKYKNFDIIIDDGCHDPKAHTVSFNHLFPHLNKNGVYCIEDLHTYFRGKYGDPSEDGEDNVRALPISKILRGKLKASMHLYRGVVFIKKIYPEPNWWFKEQSNLINRRRENPDTLCAKGKKESG